jgi:DNA-binding transcriptional MerR regulator
MTSKPKSRDNTYGIGAVAKITGLTDHTIRVWERRYEAVVAKRLENGRRVFTAADVEKLGLLKVLTDKGISISSIARQSIVELRAQAQESSDIASSLAAPKRRIAVVGEFLSAQLLAVGDSDGTVDICVADSDQARFLSDLQRHEVDVIIMESAVLDAETLRQLETCRGLSPSAKAVLVYRFGRKADAEKARESGVVVLRAPVSTEELLAAVSRACTAPGLPRAQAATADKQAAWQFGGPIAARRFTSHQLANLVNIASTIECECPQHLAQLVSDLTAFEIYSGNCANKNDEDAALHQYLHETTATARALVEDALERVAVAEGIEF